MLPFSRFSIGCVTLLAALMTVACTAPETEVSAPESAPSEAPAAETATETASPDTTTSPAPSIRTGTFASAEHETLGDVELITDDGQQTLVFDDRFSTASGPDLVVVLHRSANLIAESTPPAYPIAEEDYVVIAPLQSTAGTQEYVVPAEIDVSAFESVAVWCQEFNATFGAATLQ